MTFTNGKTTSWEVEIFWRPASLWGSKVPSRCVKHQSRSLNQWLTLWSSDQSTSITRELKCLSPPQDLLNQRHYVELSNLGSNKRSRRFCKLKWRITALNKCEKGNYENWLLISGIGCFCINIGYMLIWTIVTKSVIILKHASVAQNCCKSPHKVQSIPLVSSCVWYNASSIHLLQDWDCLPSSWFSTATSSVLCIPFAQ